MWGTDQINRNMKNICFAWLSEKGKEKIFLHLKYIVSPVGRYKTIIYLAHDVTGTFLSTPYKSEVAQGINMSSDFLFNPSAWNFMQLLAKELPNKET